MHVAVYLPLLAAAAFGPACPLLARWLPAALATVLLSWTGAVLAVAGTAAASSLALLLIHGGAATAQPSGSLHILTALVAARGPVPPLVAAAAALFVAVGAVRSCLVAIALVRQWRAAHRLARSLGGGAGQVIVVEEGQGAYALPVRGGRVVASRRLLSLLSDAEREAVLAHERAHLAHRHHRYRTLAMLSTAANPLLAALPGIVHRASERWADEEAAAVCGGSTVATALLRVGLASSGSAGGVRLGAALSDGGRDVAARAEALLAPRAPLPALLRRALVVGVTAGAVAALVSAMHAGSDEQELVHRLAGPASSASSVGAGVRTATLLDNPGPTGRAAAH